MSKVIDLHTKKELAEERKIIRVYEDELKKLINQKDVAEFEQSVFYDLVCDFIHNNNLDDQFLKHIRSEQAELVNGGYAEPVDYDFIALDFE